MITGEIKTQKDEERERELPLLVTGLLLLLI